MRTPPKIAIVGATGAVGKEVFDVLEKRRFPVNEFLAFSSARSEGKELKLGNLTARAQRLQPGCFKGVQIAFFDASDPVSKEWVPQAAEAGTWVVDSSAAYRMDPEVLLCVPEVNGAELEARMKKPVTRAHDRIIAGPNCTTAQLVVALKPLRDRWGIKRLVISTYQSASGAGAEAMKELGDQAGAVLRHESVKPKAFVHQIAFNCIPQIGGFKEDAYTSEEQKLILETRKILGLPNLKVTATAIRVPTFSCHGESVNIECERPFELKEVVSALKAQDGIVVEDDPSKSHYPMCINATGQDPVYVGRIRRDASLDHGLNMWIVADNLRKGAALNAVQIGEILLKSL